MPSPTLPTHEPTEYSSTELDEEEGREDWDDGERMEIEGEVYEGAIGGAAQVGGHQAEAEATGEPRRGRRRFDKFDVAT